MRCRAALEGLDDVHATAATRALGEWPWSVAAALSGGCGWCTVCTGATVAISSRIRAMVSVLVPLASRPQCLIRWNPLGRTWIRNRLMNSSGRRHGLVAAAGSLDPVISSN